MYVTVTCALQVPTVETDGAASDVVQLSVCKQRSGMTVRAAGLLAAEDRLPSQGGGRELAVSLAVRAGRGLERLQVSDDGPGLNGECKKGIGLTNTEARLRQLYGAAHKFEIGRSPSGGVEVTITIPFNDDEVSTASRLRVGR